MKWENAIILKKGHTCIQLLLTNLLYYDYKYPGIMEKVVHYENNGPNGCHILTRSLEFCFFRFWLKDRLLFLNRQLSENLDSNAICLYRRIWFGILRKIRNLPVVTKCFSWKDPPSLNVKSSIDKYTQKQLKCLPYKLMLVKF